MLHKLNRLRPINNKRGMALLITLAVITVLVATTVELNRQLRKSGSEVLVNLASNEYFRVVQPRSLDAEIITPVFKDLKAGKYKIISFYAKKARGQMARFIIDNELNSPDVLKKFKTDGYRYNKAESTAREPVFTRDAPPAAK